MIGSGEYRLRKKYHDLTVQLSKWFKMTTEQRKRKLDQFMKADIRIHLNPSENLNCSLDSLSLPLKWQQQCGEMLKILREMKWP